MRFFVVRNHFVNWICGKQSFHCYGRGQSGKYEGEEKKRGHCWAARERMLSGFFKCLLDPSFNILITHELLTGPLTLARRPDKDVE